MLDLICPKCGASASLPLGMTCTQHEPRPRSTPPLRVFGDGSKRVELGHGVDCVALTLWDGNRGMGGLVLDPWAARVLADSLRHQADNAESHGGEK